MDSITHVLLGGAAAYAAAGHRLGRTAFFLGALAATIPDIDVFIHTGDTIRDHLLHRHFTHALVMVPLIAALAMLPFWKRVRPHWRWACLASVLACATHGFLDVLTSYGTMILWPFSQRRFALDTVAVVDLLYTLILAAGILVSWRKRTATAARIALAVSTVYLGLAAVQHGRAADAQQRLIALRGHTGAEQPRVLPQLGAVLNYRSIYLHGGKIHADAVRVPPFAAPLVKEGSSIERASVAEIAGATRSAWQLEDFSRFADGYIARMPKSPETLGDMRYTGTPNGFDAVWGVSVDAGEPRWRMFARSRMVVRLWRDLTQPVGYLPLSMLRPAS